MEKDPDLNKELISAMLSGSTRATCQCCHISSDEKVDRYVEIPTKPPEATEDIHPK
jgi:hypothetical protein